MPTYNIEIRVRSQGARKAEAQIKGLGGTVRRAASTVNTLTLALRALPFALIARQAVRARTEFESINAALFAATGSTRAAAAEFAFIRKEADRLGLNLTAAAGSYSKLAAAAKGTALEGQAARDIFQGVATAATAMQLTGEQTAGALVAMEQIISKGRVSAEELRQQLGERLPGAFRLAAESIGVTTAELDKMLVRGELTAEELLPSLAKQLEATFGKAAQQGAKSLQAEINRLGTEVKILLSLFTGGEAAPSIVRFFAEAVQFINQSLIPALRTVAAFLQGALVGAIKIAADAFFLLAKAAAAPFDLLGQALAKFGIENPLDGFLENLEDMRRSVSDTLIPLRDAFFDVGVEQANLVGTSAEASDALQTVNDVADDGKTILDLLAESMGKTTGGLGAMATAARDAMASMQFLTGPLQLPTTGFLGAQRAALGATGTTDRTIEALRKAGEEMRNTAVQVGETVTSIGKDGMNEMTLAAREVGNKWKQVGVEVGKSLVAIISTSLGSLISGEGTAKSALSGLFGGLGGVAGGAAADVLFPGLGPIMGPVAKALGAALGSAFGGILGGVVGDLFGGGSSPFEGVDIKLIGGDLDLAGLTANKKGDLDRIRKIGESLVGQINSIIEGLGGTITGMTRDLGFIIRNGEAFLNVNGRQRSLGKDIQAAMQQFVLEFIKSATIEGLAPGAADALKRAAGTGDVQFFSESVEFIKLIETFGKTAEELKRAQITQEFEALREIAIKLGFGLEAVNAEEARRLGLLDAEAEALRKAEQEARRRENRERREEQRRLREEREQALKDALATVSPLEALSQGFDQFAEAIALLRKEVDAGKLSVERFEAAMAALQQASFVGFGDRVFGTIAQFFPQEQGFLPELVKLEEARFELAKATLNVEFERLQMIGALSDEAIAVIQAGLDFLNSNTPDFAGLITGSALPGATFAFGGQPDLQEPVDDFGKSVDRFSDSTKDFTRALEQSKAIEEQVLIALGRLDPATENVFDTLKRDLRDLFNTPALKDLFERLRPLMEEFGVVIDSVSGVVSETGMLQALKDLFDVLKAEGFGGQDASDGLGAIRDFFDDLRTTAVGKTATQRFEDVNQAFREAIATGDISRAVELGRLLSGEVGIQQFGSASQAFRNLRDEVVLLLADFLPEDERDVALEQLDVQQRMLESLDMLRAQVQITNDLLTSMSGESGTIQ